MVKMIYIFFIIITYGFSETGSQMKSPTTGAFDFTYENNLNNSIQSFNPETSLDKILVQISKQDIISRRENQIFSCMNDTYGTIYCPAALAPANKSSTYKESTVIEKSSSVIDYTNKIVTQGGTVESIVGTVEFKGQDDGGGCFATFAKTSGAGYYNDANGNNQSPTAWTFYYNGQCGGIMQLLPQEVITYWSSITNFVGCKNSTLRYKGGTSSVFGTHSFECVTTTNTTTSTCPSGYTATTGAETAKGQCKTIQNYKYYEYQCSGTNTFNEQWIAINPGFVSCFKTDTNINTINTELSTACNSSIAPTKNCVAAEYNCGENDGGIFLKDLNEYSNGIASKGTGVIINYTSKISTSKTITNTTSPTVTVDKSSFSSGGIGTFSVGASGNKMCIGNGGEDVWGSACFTLSGATVTVDKSSFSSGGIGTFSVGASGNKMCIGNGGEDVWGSACFTLSGATVTVDKSSFSSGGIGTFSVSASGNKMCIGNGGEDGWGRACFTLKGITTTETILNSVCPSGYIATTGVEREKGECRFETPYNYYSYTCPTGTNQYGYTYEIQNTGGNCNAVTLEQLMDTNNDGTGDSCNSSAPPTNNCIRKSYDAIAGINPPVYVDNQWQCSPFSCNSNKKCGYGFCPSGTTPSDTLFQDVAYNPLGVAYNGTCIGEVCDYVKNKKISYCVSKQCPIGPEYVTKDGNCYKEECPKGTYMSGSKCISSSY